MTTLQDTPRLQQLNDLLEELDGYLLGAGLGCGNGGCIVLKPRGMHTNGGCKCSTDRMVMQRYAFAQNRFTAGVRALIAQEGERDGSTP